MFSHNYTAGADGDYDLHSGADDDGALNTTHKSGEAIEMNADGSGSSVEMNADGSDSSEPG